jgi:hypothetical protein
MANTTFNPSDKSANITLSGGNLIAKNTGITQTSLVRATDKQVLGKFYWEYTVNVATDAFNMLGAASSNVATNANMSTSTGTTAVRCSNGVVYVDGNVSVVIDGSTTSVTLGALTAGSVLCVALDLTSRLVWYRIGAAGNWNNNASRNPATGVGGVVFTALAYGIPIHPAVSLSTLNDQVTANFGDTAFVGAVPSGFTSGFTAGASVPTNAIASQALAEHWLTTNPAAQVTSVVAEQWASVASGNLQAVVTFVALEHWTSVASVVPAAGGPQITMIH